MSRRRGRRELAVVALSAGALGCWLAGAAAGALTAQTGTTRAELSATAVVRTSVVAGTWDEAPARPAPTQTQPPTQAPTAIPTQTPAEAPTDPPSSSSTSS